jgi:FdhE protein
VTTLEAARERSRTLATQTPQWRPFLGLLDRALAEAASGSFDALRVERGASAGTDGGPFLLGATLVLPRVATSRWLAAALPWRVVRSRDVDPVDVLRSAVEQDDGRTEAAAVLAGEDGATLRAAGSLAALPVLFSCRRAAPHAAASQTGSCPVCGAWPTLSESRGLERLRRLRCGRCGADWGFPWLRCPFCGLSDHRRQGALVPAEGGDGRRVETCEGCRGYVKTLPTVSALAPELVPLEDLATVAFDVEAVERGFVRPSTPARALRCEIVVA